MCDYCEVIASWPYEQNNYDARNTFTLFRRAVVHYAEAMVTVNELEPIKDHSNYDAWLTVADNWSEAMQHWEGLHLMKLCQLESMSASR